MSSLSLVLPSLNREDFLLRYLRFFADRHADFDIIIADDGAQENLVARQGIISGFGGTLRLDHQRFARSPLVAKIRDATKLVSNPFTVVGADDDFQFPDALRRAGDFLAENPDYSLASGETVEFVLDVDEAYGRVLGFHPHRQNSLEEDSATDRLLHHLSDYTTTWYSVHRTEQISRILRETVSLGVDIYFEELTWSCLSVIEGKSKALPGLYMARQVHATSTSSSDSRTFDDWMSERDWVTEREGFLHCIATALADREGIEFREADAAARHAFELYVKRFSLKCSNGGSSLPVVRSMKRLGRSAIRGARSLRPHRVGPIITEEYAPHREELDSVIEAVTRR